MKPLKRIVVVVGFVPVMLLSPIVAVIQYVLYGGCGDTSPWTWLVEWAER